MTKTVNETEALNIFREANALLEGHFVLSSGKRSSVYLQCAKVLMNPKIADQLCGALAQKVMNHLAASGEEIDLCVSPAMGGVIVGYEMARQLGKPSIFTERVEGNFTLRRGFEIPQGARCLMIEDVVTTGLSSKECIDAITAQGGNTVAACSLVNRSGDRADVGVPLISLINLDAPIYDPDNLPEELKKIEAVKPGSRNLKA